MGSASPFTTFSKVTFVNLTVRSRRSTSWSFQRRGSSGEIPASSRPNRRNATLGDGERHGDRIHLPPADSTGYRDRRSARTDLGEQIPAGHSHCTLSRYVGP